MKYILLFLFSFSVHADILNWTPPTERTDNTPLAQSEISHYMVYCGDSGNYTEGTLVNGLTHTIDASLYPPNSTLYCAVTTVDTDGRESAYSTEVAMNVPDMAPPNPPGTVIFTITITPAGQ